MKILRTANIEDVAIAIIKHGNKIETRYHIPPGMSGFAFQAFKLRNMKAINKLKGGKKDEECKSMEANNLQEEQPIIQHIPDNIIIQKH